MKNVSKINDNGFTLIEVLMVIAIIGVLTSIAIPHYIVSREKAQSVTCLANRKTIESSEASYFAVNGSPSLKIPDSYRCPSGGVYLWLVSDPEHPDYPQIGCSIHFAGGLDQQESTGTSATTVNAFDDLKDAVRGLNLSPQLETKLVNLLESAKSQYLKDNTKQSEKKLGDFKNQLDKSSDKIDAADAQALIRKADEIQGQFGD